MPSGAANRDVDALSQTNFAWYPIDTMGGSSGSQVIAVGGAQAGKLVALHHGATVVRGVNEGVRVDVILPSTGHGLDPAGFMRTWKDQGDRRPEHPTGAGDTTTVEQAMAGHL